MDDDLLLKQPSDRRLGNENLPPGPPGVEYETKKDKDAPKSSRHRTSSPPIAKRKSSPQRSRRSPSSPKSGRRQRSPTPPSRQSRFRYSPSRRGRYDRHRSTDRDRRRSPSDRDRDRQRRGRSRRDNVGSRSRSRSRERTGTRWSAKDVQSSSPPPPPKITSGTIENQTIMQPPPVGVMQQTIVPQTAQYGTLPSQQTQLYGNNAYGAAYGNYRVSSQHAGFNPQADGYAIAATSSYNPSYPPPSTWGTHNSYAQQTWMQQQPTVPVHSEKTTPQQTEQQSIKKCVDGISAHDAAVAQEAENQREELKKQRNSYVKKNSILKKELRMLKDQRQDLGSNNAPPSPTTKGFIDENEKLQSQIMKKIATIENVIEMLTGVIGEEYIQPEEDVQIPIEPIISAQKMNLQMSRAISASSNNACSVAVVDPGPATTTSSGSSSSSSSSSSSDSSSSTDDEGNNQNKITLRPILVKKEDDDDSSPERLKHKVMESMKSKQKSLNAANAHREILALSDKMKLDKILKVGWSSNRTVPFPTLKYNNNQYGAENGLGSSFTSSSVSSFSESMLLSNKERKLVHRPFLIKKEKSDENSVEKFKQVVMESMKSKEKTHAVNDPRKLSKLTNKLIPDKIAVGKEPGRYNYAFYDPEMHWCQRCNIFPKSAKEYLNHLHSIEHIEKETAPDTPWHSIIVDDSFPSYDNAPTKRMPIRGITFFVPAAAWYCKLCCFWMGDLHCASVHLKSKQHAKNYTIFLERNPNFEMNWLADRQRNLNAKDYEVAAAPQITAVSTTAAVESSGKSKSKKSNEKSKKKHKKYSDKKDKKKKKKKNKKRRKSTSESSSSDSSTSDGAESDHAATAAVQKKNKLPTVVVSPIKELDNPNPAASIRVAMRNTEQNKKDDNELPPPPPSMSGGGSIKSNNTNVSAPQVNNWNVVQEGKAKPSSYQDIPNDSQPEDAIIQEWNTVKPVISDTEKKLLEQLKGKLKSSKPSSKDQSMKSDTKHNRENVSNYRKRRSRSYSRSPTRSRSRGRDWKRARSRSLRRRSRSRGRRSRSRSRGRYSPVGRSGRRRRSISRSRRRRSRSKSHNRRAHRSRSRSRSKSRGASSNVAAITASSRVEKPPIPHSEFRPRVPEKDKEKEKEKEKKSAADKKENKKSVKTTTSSSGGSSSASTLTGKKLPFIGKMPVFKKQSTSQNENESNNDVVNSTDAQNLAAAIYMSQSSVAPPPPPRTPAPTAAQINMAMMEDAYGNAPPFHPEAGVISTNMDYDDLMPDPVQFVNIMAQAPPPPAEENENTADDVLPPGIDEMEIETEKFVKKPSVEEGDDDNDDNGNLPKDLEEALNIIFPGEARPDEDENAQHALKETGETQIIVEEPVMQMDELYKDGIHLVTIEETSLLAIDEASRISMNEPLVFKKSSTVANVNNLTTDQKDDADKVESDQSRPALSQNSNETKNIKEGNTDAGPIGNGEKKVDGNDANNSTLSIPIPDEIPMPPPSGETEEKTSDAVNINLDDIPHPPAPLTESEKKRRQEELDELAMLGIDANDMAAIRM